MCLVLRVISSVGLWVDGLHLDTADTSSIDGGDLDVSLVSPGWAPGVSNDVVVLSSLGSVSDGSDGVVEVGSAGWGVEDTAVVHLEDGLVGLDGDGDDSLVEGGLELRDAVAWHVGVSSDADLTSRGELGVAVSGSSGSGGVWVVRLKSLWAGLEVLEGLVLPSTLASVARGLARDELLLGEGEEGSSLDLMGSLDASGGTESPA